MTDLGTPARAGLRLAFARVGVAFALGAAAALAGAADDVRVDDELAWSQRAAAGIANADDARALLDAAPRERARLAALRGDAQAQCGSRVLVNDCLDAAARREREALQHVEALERAARSWLREDAARDANRARADDAARRERDRPEAESRREQARERHAERLQRHAQRQAQRRADEPRRAERAAEAASRRERRERQRAEREAQAAERARAAASHAAERERRLREVERRNAERDRAATRRRDEALRREAARPADRE